VQWSSKDNIGYLVLSDPPTNQMTIALIDSLYSTVKSINTDKLKGLIVSGQGRNFSSGAVLQELVSKIREETLLSDAGEILEAPIFMTKYISLMEIIEQMSVPVVAAINGVCWGSGLEVALACHFRICGEGATLGSPESQFNLMPGMGANKRLARILGKAQALYLLVSGKTYTAQDALEMGVVDLVVGKKNVLQTSIDVIEKFHQVEGLTHEERR